MTRGCGTVYIIFLLTGFATYLLQELCTPVFCTAIYNGGYVCNSKMVFRHSSLNNEHKKLILKVAKIVNGKLNWEISLSI